jgi:FPC/CPF motif-containing protein YcgG
MTVNPFDSELARRHSCYFGTRDGRPVLLSDPDRPPDLFASAVIGAFRGFVLNPQFVCVGAKAAVNHETYRLGVYDRLASPEATAGLSHDLYAFLSEVGAADNEFTTFVATFREPTDLDEVGFEKLLWAQLQMLHDQDAPLHDWDPAVSSNPDDPHFSFSFAGHAFFIVGLHPGSTRLARQFPWPTLVFNPHAQFERLREEGKFEKLKEVVRQREEQLEGGVSPVLADFGADTEAKQYAGRVVEPGWHPPFVPHPGGPIDVATADAPVPSTAPAPPGCPVTQGAPRRTRTDR